jgi:hypothetical protein
MIYNRPTLFRFAPVLGLVAGIFFLSSAAHAGFQYVPGPVSAPAPVSAAPAPVTVPLSAPMLPVQTTPAAALPAPVIIDPPPQVGFEMQPPLIIDPPAAVAALAPQPVAAAPAAMAPVPMAPSAPVPLAPAPVQAVAPIDMAPPSFAVAPAVVQNTSGVSDGAVVQGFADNMPLVAAMRQVLPPSYGFTVADGVDINTLVSWQGGAAWGDVLTKMLIPAGLQATISGQNVVVSPAGSSVAAAPAPAPYAPYVGGGFQANDVPVSSAPALPPVANVPVAPVGDFASPVPPAVETAVAVEVWQANAGQTLRDVLQSWAERTNTELYWSADYDYPLFASFNYQGRFEDAVRLILQGFEKASPQPTARLHLNPELGQSVLVVEVRGNHGGE